MSLKELDFEAWCEIRAKRRARSDGRAYDKMTRQMAKAEYLIGELQGEKGKRFYINLRYRDGRFTGKIREFPLWVQAFDYLARNGYL